MLGKVPNIRNKLAYKQPNSGSLAKVVLRLFISQIYKIIATNIQKTSGQRNINYTSQ
jgi:hypothetical protein